MRRKIAIGTLGLMVLLAAAMISWAEEGAPQAGDPPQGQHQMGGGQHQWGDGPHKFDGGNRGQFGGRRWQDGREGHRMGWQRDGRGRFGGGDHLMRMAENPRIRQYLGLTDDQVARLHKIGIESEKASVQTRADVQLRHIELRELLRSDNPDHDAIMRKLDEVNALQGKIQKQRVETLLSARSVLTPEQLNKIKTFMENRGGGPGRGPMERRGGMGRPPHPAGPGGAPGAATPNPPQQ